MSHLLEPYLAHLPTSLRALPWRGLPLDGKLLLFERSSGLNILLEGQETAALRQTAPRTLLIAVTNHCNLSCPFCYRDQSSASTWNFDDLLGFCQAADRWGVLEVAFGGGEPLLFPRWAAFIEALYTTTKLAINFTTNGSLLRPAFLQRVGPKLGQIRLSLYDDNDYRSTLKLLRAAPVRYGVNWLITPQALAHAEATLADLLAHGVQDFLLLRYKGPDRHLNLDQTQSAELAAFVRQAHAALGSQISLKVGSCWGSTLDGVPRLFDHHDCGAGVAFLSITSDKQVKPCSFHHWTAPFQTFEDVRRIWQDLRDQPQPAYLAGCARRPAQITLQIYNS
ncbi:MAG: radical SAM protein [Chloroflexi bacterium]|nr:radical SAM protein [Chloroflexota bacterium]